jgi:glutamine cyclotransferase
MSAKEPRLMRPTAASRLAALAAAALIAAGCAGAPRTASPAASSPQSTLPTSAPGAEPTTALDGAYPAVQSAYPQPAAGPAQQSAPTLRVRVVNSYPHDRGAWTQGLVSIGGDSFYEGTGLVGRSTLREVALDGTVRRKVDLDPAVFGEGVAVVGERIFQLTWQDCVGYIYDRAAFKQVGRFTMPTDPRDGQCLEGWGLTYDGARLILSDGSERLFFVDPAATERTGQLAITGQVAVQDGGNPVARLNELEFVDGEVYANIWMDERVARIDPASGRVTAFIDMSSLRALLPPEPSNPEQPEVLNGIAYDAAGDRLFVTGKWWPLLFEVDVVGAVSWVVYLPVAERA